MNLNRRMLILGSTATALGVVLPAMSAAEPTIVVMHSFTIVQMWNSGSITCVRTPKGESPYRWKDSEVHIDDRVPKGMMVINPTYDRTLRGHPKPKGLILPISKEA